MLQRGHQSNIHPQSPPVVQPFRLCYRPRLPQPHRICPLKDQQHCRVHRIWKQC
uniref:Uncharacterized protein n=1 Tax=Arundo donax TaxID=35708 RepID=A0A0A8Y9Z4_ARUDO